MKHLLLTALLYLAACGTARATSRHLLLAPPLLKVGMNARDAAPLVEWLDSKPQGFEGLLMEALMEEAGYTPQVVPLWDWDERILGLENGTLDAVVDAFTVTNFRTKQVEFLKPFYYSSGAALFTPDGTLPGVSSWADLKGKTIVTMPGNYLIDAAATTPDLKGVQIEVVKGPEEAAEWIAAGKAVAYTSDSTMFNPGGNLSIVADMEPILREPYGVAVEKGDTELAGKLSAALLKLMQGGQGALTFVAAGGAPNPDLAALVAAPTPGNSTLYPALADERSCGTAPSDSIWLSPAEWEAMYQWNITGVQNWTCDPKTSNWTYLGWRANATDTSTGKHAGWAVTVEGPTGNHLPYFVATNESNTTVTGTLINVREAGSVDMPSPTDPSATFWYRRPAYDQTGIFLEPKKVLWLTKTNTSGGSLPKETMAAGCKAGDPMIKMPVVSIFTFYACKQ